MGIRRRHLAAVVAAGIVLVFGGVAGASAQLPPVDPPPETPPGVEAPQAGSGGGHPAGSPTTTAGENLVGLFSVKDGVCTTAAIPQGSWFRMVTANGDPATGPFVDNNDSPCSDKSATTLQAGRDGGLRTGSFQAAPNPAFDGSGNGLADRIVKPQRFYNVGFALASNPTDPQTNLGVVAPALTNNGGQLSGDLRALGVAWNRQHFNQGSPKPDGSRPGKTTGPAGTIDVRTGAFVLDWSSQIQGGPFNNFIGVWHLEGTFRADAVAASGNQSGSGSSATSASNTTAASPAGVAGSSTAGGPSSGTTGSHPRTGGATPLGAGVVLLAAAASRVVRRARR
ncbi:MAG: hypothetical protein ACR2H3_05140 [Acidimicrobiales bacterium]